MKKEETIDEKLDRLSGAGECKPIKAQLDALSDARLNKRPAVKTGFKRLDEMTGGLPRGVTVLGGMAGTGKTAFASQIAFQIAENSGFVIFCSLEMDSSDIFERLLSIANRAEKYNIFNDETAFKALFLQEKNKPHDAFNRIYLDDFSDSDKTANAVLRFIQKCTAQIRQKQGEQAEIVAIIDHLQHIENKGFQGEQAQFLTIDDAFKGLEIISKALKIKVLCLSQLNRQAYTTVTDKGIQMNDFKGASRIEQGAVTLLGMTKGDGYIRLNNPKCRFNKGFNGFINYRFNGVYFEEETTETKAQQGAQKKKDN